MIALLDTSVLIAGVLGSHPKNPEAIRWMADAKVGKTRGVVCQHGLAETYAVLTGLPPVSRIPPPDAAKLIHDLATFVEIVELGSTDYLDAISRLAAAKLEGGIVNDMLHAVAAEKANADILVTGNVRDFQRLPFLRQVDVVDLGSRP